MDHTAASVTFHDFVFACPFPVISVFRGCQFWRSVRPSGWIALAAGEGNNGGTLPRCRYGPRKREFSPAPLEILF
jgi:hypothetical protein